MQLPAARSWQSAGKAPLGHSPTAPCWLCPFHPPTGSPLCIEGPWWKPPGGEAYGETDDRVGVGHVSLLRCRSSRREKGWVSELPGPQGLRQAKAGRSGLYVSFLYLKKSLVGVV